MAHEETARLKKWPPESIEGWPTTWGLPQPIYRDILCPRCKEFHEQVDIRVLLNPTEDVRWYLLCPKLHQPVFLRENPALSDSAGLWVCESDFLERYKSGHLSTSAALVAAAMLKIAATTLARWSLWWKRRAFKKMVRKAYGSTTSEVGPCTQIG